MVGLKTNYYKNYDITAQMENQWIFLAVFGSRQKRKNNPNYSLFWQKWYCFMAHFGHKSSPSSCLFCANLQNRGKTCSKRPSMNEFLNYSRVHKNESKVFHSTKVKKSLTNNGNFFFQTLNDFCEFFVPKKLVCWMHLWIDCALDKTRFF